MSFDYFYGQQSDLFTFYRVPKVLFTNERFWNISADAKMLYGILLDRMSLSAKNGWIDKNGRVYIIFTIDEAKMALNCAEQKAIKLLSELEKKAGLIERKRQGLGKPNLIYVKNFISAVDSQLLNCENHNSGTMEITTQELPKSQCNNTDIKNTEFSDTDSIFPSGNGGMMDENDRYQEYFDYFSDQLSMDLLKKDYPYDSEMLDNILELIVETVCTKRPLIRIGAEERPAEIVRSRFMKLNPQAVQIGCELEDLQKAVGGDIEATYPFNEPVALVMHDEGKLAGKDLNRALRDDDGDIYDIVAGDFLVVGLGEDDFCSLSPELMKQFEEHFHQPETFVRMGRSIMALPLPDDMVKKEDAPVKADSVPHKSNPDRDVL